MLSACPEKPSRLQDVEFGAEGHSIAAVEGAGSVQLVDDTPDEATVRSYIKNLRKALKKDLLFFNGIVVGYRARRGNWNVISFKVLF